MSAVKKFTFVVYVLFGVLAILAAVTGLAFLFFAWPIGLLILVASCVLYLLSLSVGKSLKDLA